VLIKSVSIKNFCSCSNLTIELAAFNPFIGYNNSGKSNMLRAIGWLLKKSVLSKSSFFDQNQPVIVEGIISGVDLNLLPTNQQQATAPYVINNELHFRRRQDTPQSTAAQIKIDVLDPGTQQWRPNPAGLDTAIGVLFPEPLYIEAMEDAAEDVGKFGAKNTIGELIKKTILLVRQNNAAAVQGIELALQGLDSHLNGTTRIQELASLEANATKAVDDFFPGLSLKINFQTPQLDEILKGATVDLSERPGSSQPFSSFGHGAQRTVQMALIRLLAETAQQTTGTGPITVLLIDEPELYLHPQAIELLRAALKSLSQRGYQVIFSTHSPLLVRKEEVLHAALVYKDNHGQTKVRPKIANAATTMANHPHQSSVIFQLQNSSYILFSEKILLAEGKTEKMILPEIYETLRGRSLALDKVCMVEAGGSPSLWPMREVLRSVGFTPKIVTDLDFAFKVAPNLGLISLQDPDLNSCKAWFASNSGTFGFVLGTDGLPAKKDDLGNTGRIKPEEAFGLMASTMTQEVERIALLLKQNHNIWIWSRGAIEAHLGIAKDDMARMNFITFMQTNGTITHAAHANEIQEFINWL